MKPAQAPFMVGAAKVELAGVGTGARLVGYGNRASHARGTHDPLFARALCVGTDERAIAICAVDLCYVGEDIVAAARLRVSEQTDLTLDDVFVSATHTHSGPLDADRTCFPDGLEAEISTALVQAWERRQLAHIGAGWGMLHGRSLNRRRLEDPVDPAVAVIRADALDGTPICALYAFGCHPVILGPDNLAVSGDWPAVASQTVEDELGEGAIAMFLQGAGADVNPITDQVLARLADGQPVLTTALGSTYYGPDTRRFDFSIGNRFGGTFDEARKLGDHVAAEVLHVRAGIRPGLASHVWTHRFFVPTDAQPVGTLPAGLDSPRARTGSPLEIMLVGIEGPGILLVGEPGEIFARTGVSLRRKLRATGIPVPIVVSHANGRRGYLPPADAFPEGGYEVDWALACGIPPSVQGDVARATLARAAVRPGMRTAPEPLSRGRVA